MNTTTVTLKTSSHKPTAARTRPAAKAKAAPTPPASEHTTLAKKMPDYLHPKKKQKRIVANVNVGWGNAVYVRGDGGGLSWYTGMPLISLADDQWVWFYSEDDAPREIKFLRNDMVWALGENHVVLVEEVSLFTPQFP